MTSSDCTNLDRWSAAIPSLLGSRILLGMRSFRQEQDLEDTTAPDFKAGGNGVQVETGESNISHGVISTFIVPAP